MGRRRWEGREGQELREEGRGAMQEGREHATKGERWEEGKEGWGWDEGETCVGEEGDGEGGC